MANVLSALKVASSRNNYEKALSLSHAILEIPLDTSGANLSGLALRPGLSGPGSFDLDLVAGIIWSNDTVWPTEYRKSIEANSRQIRRGVFQVIASLSA